MISTRLFINNYFLEFLILRRHCDHIKYKDINLPVISIIRDYLLGYPYTISNFWSHSLLSFISHI